MKSNHLFKELLLILGIVAPRQPCARSRDAATGTRGSFRLLIR
jgi:hypothetical protein